MYVCVDGGSKLVEVEGRRAVGGRRRAARPAAAVCVCVRARAR
jgi:hypothetical protein